VIGGEIEVSPISEGVLHLKVPRVYLHSFLIPGISRHADKIDLFFLEDSEILSEKLHLLGNSFLVDQLENAPGQLEGIIMQTQRQKVWSSKPPPSWFCTSNDSMFYALPLETSMQGYVMQYQRPRSTPRYTIEESLFKCSTAYLFDVEQETQDTCVHLCIFSLDHLMGACQLGGPTCRKGLMRVSNKHKTPSKPIESEA
tara:strand:+ start:1038 stop:1634 length:597 start_codon:yes stop_codon:yes gene_type:complete